MRSYTFIFALAILFTAVSCDKDEIVQGEEVLSETVDRVTMVQEDGSEIVYTITNRSDGTSSTIVTGAEGVLSARATDFPGDRESSEPNNDGGKDVRFKASSNHCFTSSYPVSEDSGVF